MLACRVHPPQYPHAYLPTHPTPPFSTPHADPLWAPCPPPPPHPTCIMHSSLVLLLKAVLVASLYLGLMNSLMMPPGERGGQEGGMGGTEVRRAYKQGKEGQGRGMKGQEGAGRGQEGTTPLPVFLYSPAHLPLPPCPYSSTPLPVSLTPLPVLPCTPIHLLLPPAHLPLSPYSSPSTPCPSSLSPYPSPSTPLPIFHYPLTRLLQLVHVRAELDDQLVDVTREGGETCKGRQREEPLSRLRD